MSQLEGRDPAGQAVDVALGSRSYREATVRSHGCGVKRQVSLTGAEEELPGRR